MKAPHPPQLQALAGGPQQALAPAGPLPLPPDLCQHPRNHPLWAPRACKERGLPIRKIPKAPLFLHNPQPSSSLDLGVGWGGSRGPPEDASAHPKAPPLSSPISPPPPRTPVTWGRGEAPPGGGITPLAMAG